MDPSEPPPYPHSSPKATPSPHSYALSGKIMLSAIVILFSIVLLILFLHFYVRWHVLRRATRRARRRARRLLFSSEDRLSPPPNRAIDPSILNSLPVLLFSPAASASSEDNDLDECDCAVCLNEFEDGQKIRTLPRCGHSFHIDCIDMWFASHANCPLCRAPVEAAPSDFCSSCRRRGEEEIGSSSSDAGDGELAIEMAQGGLDGFSGEAERLGLGRALKWPMNRLVLLRRFLAPEIPRASEDAQPDLEGGEGAPPPPPQ